MALKDEIYTALITNIQPDNPGENFDLSDTAIDKVEKLSENLTTAIKRYIDDLVFRVHDLKADTVILPGTIQTSAGPNVNPIKVSVKVSQDNPTGITDQPNALQSVVKVDSNVNRDKSGIA